MPATAHKKETIDAAFVGARVRALRESRRWSQAELAKRLGLSQPRLSQVERGQGSFTAENLLQILRLFNVGVDQFGVVLSGSSPIQNALARHGAAHLVEDDTLVPTSLDEPLAVAWEVLRSPESPRHLTALAPVLLANIDRIALPELAARLARVGREARLGWLLETLRAAITEVASSDAPLRRELRRVDLAAALALAGNMLRPPSPDAPLDLLDPDIRSAKTADRVLLEAAPEAKRWRIATRLRPTDFADAIRAARDVD